jgi:hypothetical protein
MEHLPRYSLPGSIDTRAAYTRARTLKLIANCVISFKVHLLLAYVYLL